MHRDLPSQNRGLRRIRRWSIWALDKLSLWLLMYCVTLSLFLYETGSLGKAAGFALVAASAKTLAAVGHRQISRSFLPDIEPD